MLKSFKLGNHIQGLEEALWLFHDNKLKEISMIQELNWHVHPRAREGAQNCSLALACAPEEKQK